MIIKVFDYENGTMLLEFKERKNSKKVVEHIKQKLQEKYNCSIRRVMIQGKIDYLTPSNTDLHYVMWGDNLPCKMFNYSAFM